MHPAWARVLRDQCRSDGVPFFFKSWGARGGKVGKQRTGDLIDGTQYHEYPEGR
jgi:protein gp37